MAGNEWEESVVSVVMWPALVVEARRVAWCSD